MKVLLKLFKNDLLTNVLMILVNNTILVNSYISLLIKNNQKKLIFFNYRNVMSTTFSQQILCDKLLLIVICG